MAAITVTSREELIAGNIRAVFATTADIANTNTWDTGLKQVLAVFITNGQSGQTYGATYSGGTVTFAASAGMSNCKLLAIGY